MSREGAYRWFLSTHVAWAVVLFTLAGCDAQTGIRLEQSLDDVKGSVNVVDFSPDGKYVLSGGFDGVYVWRVRTGRLLGHFSHNVESMAVLPGGRVLVGSPRRLDLWDYETGKRIKEFPGHEAAVFAIAVSPDGRYALSGTGFKWFSKPAARVRGECLIRLWDLSSGQELKRFEGNAGAVVALAFLPDGKHFLSVSGDTTLRLWNLESGEEVHREGTAKQPRTLTGGNGLEVVTNNAPKESLDVTRDGRMALRGQTLWDLDTWKPVATFGEDRREPLACSRFSPDDSRVLTVHPDDTIRLWDMATKREIARVNASPRNGAGIYAAAFSPDGRRAASGGIGGVGGFVALRKKVPAEDTTVRLWRLPD